MYKMIQVSDIDHGTLFFHNFFCFGNRILSRHNEIAGVINMFLYSPEYYSMGANEVFNLCIVFLDIICVVLVLNENRFKKSNDVLFLTNFNKLCHLN